MAKRHFADRCCPDCGRVFAPAGSRAIRCPCCRKRHNRAVQHTYDRQHREPPMPPRERVCLCGQQYISHNAKRCPTCAAYTYKDIEHVWFREWPSLTDDPDWRHLSLEEWRELHDEMEITLRRAKARIDAEKELVEHAHIEKQERLQTVLECLLNPFAVP